MLSYLAYLTNSSIWKQPEINVDVNKMYAKRIWVLCSIIIVLNGRQLTGWTYPSKICLSAQTRGINLVISRDVCMCHGKSFSYIGSCNMNISPLSLCLSIHVPLGRHRIMLLEYHSLENTTSWSKVPSFHYSLRQINYLFYIFRSIVKVYEGFVIV